MINLTATDLQMNLGELVHQCARQFADRPCITMADDSDVVTYREFESRINQIAHGVKNNLEARSGDEDQFSGKSRFIAIMLENSITYVAITYALKKTQYVEVSINRAFRGAALGRTINLTCCKTLFTSAAHFDALLQVYTDLQHLRTLVIIDDVPLAKTLFPTLNIVDFTDLLADNDTHISSSAGDLETASIMFTSGTTGVSKGCVLSHRYALRTAQNLIRPFRVTADDVSYTPYPLSHAGPAYYDILPTLITGGKVVLRDGFSLSAFWPEVSRHGVTWFLCLGSVQQLLYSARPGKFDKKHSVTRCWATPAPVAKADFDRRFNLHLIPGGGYGSTDAGWVVAPQWDHPGGKVLPQFEIAIVDEDDNPLPSGCDGELVIRSKEPGVMSDEYFGMPEKTLESRRNLWFHTGDIAQVDDAGLFYFRYRMAERIRVLGEMVSGFEVEEGALTHPCIEDAAAIGIPATFGEETVRLFVTLKPGETATAEEIRAHCSRCMAKFMVPSVVTILDNMPRTTTGKPEKGELGKLPL